MNTAITLQQKIESKVALALMCIAVYGFAFGVIIGFVVGRYVN